MSNNNNSFGGSSIHSHSVATESTLRKVKDVLVDGSIDVNIVSGGSGGGPTANVLLTDVEFVDPQTDLLGCKLTNCEHKDGDSVTITDCAICIGGVQDGTHKFINISDTGGVRTTDTNLITTNTQTPLLDPPQGHVILMESEQKSGDSLWVPLKAEYTTHSLLVSQGSNLVDGNLRKIHGIDIETGNGIQGSGGCLRVAVCSDNNPITIDNQYWTREPIISRLTNGSTENAIGDYSVTPSDFIYTTTKIDFYITEVHLMMQEGSAFNIDNYAGVPPLTNGIQLFYTQNGSSKKYLIDTPIKSNRDFLSFCYDTKNNTSEWPGENSMCVKFNLSQSCASICLPQIGDKIGFELSDDFTTGITYQHFSVSGYYQN